MLNILIAEDDFASRKLMHALLKSYGDCDIAVNGKEAVMAFKSVMEKGKRYDLICLDILMPEMDGHETLQEIREIEKKYEIFGSNRVKIIMTTALADGKNIMEAFREQCEAYLVKPIKREKLVEQLNILGLLDEK